MMDTQHNPATPLSAPSPASDDELVDAPRREYDACERRVREILGGYVESDVHAAAAASAIMTVAQEYARAIGRLYVRARAEREPPHA
jgi:hypothetical protein